MEMPGLDGRQERGLTLARKARIKQIVASTWLVPSQSHSGTYVVDSEKGECTCPDHELRGRDDGSTPGVICKHRWALFYARQHFIAPDGSEAVIETLRIAYPPRGGRAAYNAAQCEQKDRVKLLLKALCDGVHNPPQVGRGRRRAALGDVIFAAAMKNYIGKSGRLATCEIEACAAEGLIDKVPAYNTIFEYFEQPELTPILKRLVRVSAVPLANMETKFAIDATGFTAKVYERWFDLKYGREKKEAKGIKLHAVCGVRSKIITAVEVTDATIHESPLLPQLVQETAQTFTMEEVLADKGYLATSNLEAIEAVGAKPYIAFKKNSTSSGTDVWRRAYHMFAMHDKEWLKTYGDRSGIEGVFSAVKRLYGGSVRSKTPTAMANEAITKCLVFNLGVLVRAIHTHGLAPQFWSESMPALEVAQ